MPPEKFNAMRDQLIGYLLGALEPHEQEQVEAYLRDHPQCQRELEQLRAWMGVLSDAEPAIDPPAGLARKTCRFVAMRAQSACEMGEFIATRRWRLQDAAVAAGILIATSLLIFPAIANSRLLAQRTACQRNLQRIGMALATYSEYYAGLMPVVYDKGPLATAGAYVPELNFHTLLEEPGWVLCPAAPRAQRERFRVVTLGEVCAAVSREELLALQRNLGGNYNYSLGYFVDGRYRAGRVFGPTHVAIMSDRPVESLDGGTYHGKGIQNVMYSDGHVEAVLSPPRGEVGLVEDIFRNDLGQQNAGVHADDAVVVPSWVGPDPAHLLNY